MKVKALVSFVDMAHGSRAAGDVFELPDGVDWLRAGLVAVVAEPDPEPEPAPEVLKPARKKKG